MLTFSLSFKHKICYPLKEVTTALQNFHINPQRKTASRKMLIAEIVQARFEVQQDIAEKAMKLSLKKCKSN